MNNTFSIHLTTLDDSHQQGGFLYNTRLLTSVLRLCYNIARWLLTVRPVRWRLNEAYYKT
jgi:hypothetical protein